ncbi:MAG: hypothetical protein OHK0013_03550 [Sandaracinaceae bacterium]
MIDLATVRRQLEGSSLVRGIDQLEKGHVRLETSFLYPDGASIDLFLENRDPLLPAEVLSDFGQTMSWLLDVQVKPWMSKKRQRFLEDALRIYDVKQQGGALETKLTPDLTNLVDAVVRLGQACVRVADLTYTRRTSAQAGVVEEVEEVLADANLDYDVAAVLTGRYGNAVPVDFLVRGRNAASAVITLSATNTSTAHSVANEIFRRWYDLDVPQRSEQRVTVLDDRYDTYRTEDIQRLGDISNVIALSDRRTLTDLLAA